MDKVKTLQVGTIFEDSPLGLEQVAPRDVEGRELQRTAFPFGRFTAEPDSASGVGV